MFDVLFGTNRAQKEYERLDEKMREKVNEFCEAIKAVPVPFRLYDIRKCDAQNFLT